MKAAFISLGCAKNLVDSEFILGFLEKSGIAIVNDPEKADVIFVNTCAFIEPAREETRETIAEMHAYGKKIVMLGCYAKRYRDRIQKEMPYVNKVVSLDEYPDLAQIMKDFFKDDSLSFAKLDYHNRMLTGNPYSSYVKISEGCDNRCAYCAIPMIRGQFRSRPYKEIIDECRLLIKNGAKEITLIGQDTTKYGTDLNDNVTLASLMKEIAAIENVFLVRVLYLYPDEVTDELIEAMVSNEKIAPYFDLPIQHISTPLLKLMNRRGDENDIRALLKKIKDKKSDAIIRTTLIVGFPGETDADYSKLADFVFESGFDRLGAFMYSKEEGTKAFSMENMVLPEVMQNRYDNIMRIQRRVSRKQNQKQVGLIHKTLVENYDPETGFYYGRSYAFAPDDVDGYIVFKSKRELKMGEVVDVLIKECIGYDLIGDEIG
ncbi:MAG TPA: 30S ribosomal protein S12 methylthiotransferase RimO [Bacillota bacterium]|nr:30S ribosomal protein S12 methylthiotransferase RimO [Bacillota bacterium]HPF42646.1 30S ribosomal protein S12 methylthiotransferase RimO [Bacillota bacterium]HPJ85531.1 30S ribosomal protein S12 methylthiotransferase RimO [Bacillota bacterium]HRX92178.1 30S ribosomal protein S12 methylthiotransferase RimO [Candidatus Izemoplasmatales bacterium]